MKNYKMQFDTKPCNAQKDKLENAQDKDVKGGKFNVSSLT
jgi:hypothetical protein